MTNQTHAIISEGGNGLPDVGDFVGGSDGELYSISSHGPIRCGANGRWYEAVIEPVEGGWKSLEENEVFDAQCIIADAEAEAETKEIHADAYYDATVADDDECGSTR